MKNKLHLFILSLLCFLLFLPFFLKPEILTTLDNDLGRTYIPIYQDIQNSVHKFKQFPLYSSRQMMGESLVASPLPALYYPPNLLFLIFPVDFAVVLYLFAHLTFAALATFYLARAFNFSNLSSVAAAIFYAFSTKILLHLSAGHLTMIAAFAYFPIIFLALKKLSEKPSFNWISTGSLALAAQLITHLTIFYYTTIFILIYYFYLIITKIKDKQKFSFWAKTFPIFLMIVLSLCLGAISLAPTLDFNATFSRGALKLEEVAVPIWNFKRLLFSLFFPYPILDTLDHEALLYFGFVPMFLAFIGFIKLPTSKKLAILFFTSLSVLFVAGLSTPVFRLAYDHLPLLKYSRVTTRLWFVNTLIIALLASYALNRFKKTKITYLYLAIFLIESVFLFTNKLNNINHLSFQNEQIYQFLAQDTDYFRVYCTSSCFNPQLLVKYNLQILNGETPIQNTDFIDFLARSGNYYFEDFAVIFPPYQVWQTAKPPTPNAHLLGLANVKYIASSYSIAGENFNFIRQFGKVFLYQNQKFQNRAYFPSSPKQATISYFSPNRISLDLVKAPNFQKLVLAENFSPGWFTYIDGRKYNLQKEAPIFRSVSIPPNTSKISIIYQPQSLVIGRTITFATIFTLIMYFCYSRKRNNHG